MKTLSLLAVFWMCLQPVCADDSRPKFVRKPTVMSVMVGGAYGQSYEITYDERELRYYSAKDFFALKTAKPSVVKPTEDQWQTFFDELEKLNVWNWKRHYTNPNVHDGIYWHATVIYSTREARDLVSSGSNAYPSNFKAFLAAVQKLAGDRKFE